MKVEISVDCIDDTGRIPKGQVITWIVRGEPASRDARIRVVSDLIVDALKERYPKPRDGRTKVGKL